MIERLGEVVIEDAETAPGPENKENVLSSNSTEKAEEDDQKSPVGLGEGAVLGDELLADGSDCSGEEGWYHFICYVEMSDWSCGKFYTSDVFEQNVLFR